MIVSNAGEEGAVVIGKILDSKEANFGYNAGTGAYEDLGEGRYHRPHQGYPHCPAERGFHRWSHAHHRGHDLRDSRRRKLLPVDTTTAAWTACTKPSSRRTTRRPPEIPGGLRLKPTKARFN